MRYIRLCLVVAMCVAAPSVHAADDILPHQLTVNLGGHTRLNRTIDTDSVLNESGVIHHATSHREYSEVLTPTATGFTVTRTLTKFAITPATAPDALINTP